MRRNCLEPDELRQVLEGDLSREQFDSAISHLDTCETCRTAVEQFDGGLQAIGESTSCEDAARAGVQNETACQVALQQLLQQSSALIPSTVAPPPPFEMLGPYRLLELIGSGGMGAVYLAEHQRLKRRCAIKLLPPERVTQAGWLDRFDREMTTIASLEHPHIVCATDAGHEAGWHYLVMEYLDGMDIGRVAGRIGQLNVADACEIVRQAALGLAHIHDSGLVHRDIKPSNLMLTQSGTIKLLDLGLVLDGDDPLSKDDRLTTVGHVMGTMPYMAPEQLADSRDVRPQSDIYSLGATLYRLIAGHPPHRSERGLAAQVLAITSSDAKPLDTIRSDVDRDVVSFVAGMLSRDPAKRPASAMEVARQLESMAKPSHLKRLLRDAIRKHSTDDLPRSTLLPSIAKSGGSKDRGRIKHWLMGSAAALCLIAATIVIKIQTDRGDLVIHSEHDGLTVLVKQGDDVVDQLTIESDKENRTTLHKGTYDIEIIGGGDALRLSDEVVTVGRGTRQSIDVVKRTEPANPLLAETAMANPAAPDDEGAVPSVTSTKPATADASTGTQGMSGMGGMASPMELVSYEGKPLSYWLEQIQTETEIESLGEAVYASIGGLQELSRRGMASNSDVQTVIEAVLRRAREFGGLSRKLPPLPGTTDQSITPSEHFMWCLTEVFAEPSFDVWYETAVRELIEGNVNSRAAVITCLYRQVTVARSGGLYGGIGGGMGGFGGGYDPGGAMGGTISKFTTSKLIRCCLSLATADAWSELAGDQRKLAASMTREVLIDLPRSLGMGLSQEASKELTSVILAIPEKERNIWEQGFIPANNADPNNTGMSDSGYEGDGMSMMNYVEDESVATDASPETLFQGRDLASWLDSLDRERDLGSLIEAIDAVEILSRESDATTRRMAAERTMSLARRFGGKWAGSPIGFDVTNSAAPSPGFMAKFPGVFSRYLPDPGLNVALNELNKGNDQSKLASVWAIRNFFSGVYVDTVSTESLTALRNWISTAKADPERREELLQLCDQLLDVADQYSAKTGQQGLLQGFDVESNARQTALEIILLLGEDVTDHPRLESYVKKRISQEIDRLEGASRHDSENVPPASFSLSDMIAVIQIAEKEDGVVTQQLWRSMATAVVVKQYDVMSNKIPMILEAIYQREPDALLQAVHSRFGLESLLHQPSTETLKLIRFYADHESSVERLDEVRERLRSMAAEVGVQVGDLEKPFVDAIEQRKVDTKPTETP
ncbi:serine/threonine protein kinase [Stieleria sp. ICT_E10.1]|uniref:serine/threonine protein kinase n=1 Tax=Stieleria sedimenti TaxID=2976331 RepID=UPI002180321F|nr:serine/threonine-protein kinase [Stieleria sedimenti]MCS7471199.1 serine/threonine protein kinase [Stieleria sedimenti]